MQQAGPRPMGAAIKRTAAQAFHVKKGTACGGHCVTCRPAFFVFTACDGCRPAMIRNAARMLISVPAHSRSETRCMICRHGQAYAGHHSACSAGNTGPMISTAIPGRCYAHSRRAGPHDDDQQRCRIYFDILKAESRTDPAGRETA